MPDRSATASPPSSLVSLADARAYLGGVSAQTLYRLVADGQLTIIKVRRRSFLRRSDLERLVGGG
jgi:excisionase family DNA binding protein